MARGVSQNFLDIARREERLAKRTMLTAAAVVPLGAFLSELSDAPGYGPMWWLFLGAVGAGLLAGFWLTRQRLARWEDDLALRWNHWMRHASHAASLAEVERKVHARDPPPGWRTGALTAAVVAVNLLLFALLWAAHDAAGLLAIAVILLDGLVLGALVTSSAILERWARNLVRSAEELVRSGEVGMWGER